ncbi:MAG: DUF3536 domain-containing protein [Elusimicrobia bacterium]|nr:DUF3536 domain-containing protein [Elusimicrobiota bacterium]
MKPPSGQPTKFVCVHGHFYQPPRENPWLEEGEPEESASPYRDWNERILNECYGPNAAAPSLDGFGRIRELRNNYEALSFNFGATLSSWLERKHPALYSLILEADRSSLEARGHGNAIAQPFIHAILPLQTRRDKRTMVRWGIADFEFRFNRKPEGMWLPETGVDDETLEVLIEEGIRFTILAPHQAAKVRALGAEQWTVPGEPPLNTSRPYRWNSKAQPGKSIALFFFYNELHLEVARRQGLADGERLARKFRACFMPDASVQLVHTATDGEYFGHHRKRGHEALSQAFQWLESEGAKVVNYAQFLDLYPPPQEVELAQDTAWSCAHGLGRWSDDCGCKIEPDKPTQQRWRKPLLEALGWLKAKLDEVYEKEAAVLFRDPWLARDHYVSRLLDDSPSAADAFLFKHAKRNLTPKEALTCLRLCEMQRWRLLMLTSCGWFFDDISGIEAVQNLRFAGRAIELAGASAPELERGFKDLLLRAPSNEGRFATGAGVFEKLVTPVRTDSHRAAAHAAILRHLDPDTAPRMPRRFSFSGGELRRWDKPLLAGQDRSLSASRTDITDKAILEADRFWTVVHQQDRLDFSCWVSPMPPPDDLKEKFLELGDADLQTYLAKTMGESRWGMDAVLPGERVSLLRISMSAPPKSDLRRYLEAWRSAVRRLDQPGGADLVLDLIPKAKALGLAVDQLPDLDLVREHLSEIVSSVEVKADQASVSRFVRWIETCETAGVHLGLWELNSFCWNWKAQLRRSSDVATFESDAAEALARKLNFSEAPVEASWRPRG